MLWSFGTFAKLSSFFNWNDLAVESLNESHEPILDVH